MNMHTSTFTPAYIHMYDAAMPSKHNWGISSDGRVPALHAGGAGIDTQILQISFVHK